MLLCNRLRSTGDRDGADESLRGLAQQIDGTILARGREAVIGGRFLESLTDDLFDRHLTDINI